ncbi:hypothetical protein SESBI_19793 [Sesbania bispinosa]|nr:hypothetical protein SESBI_19793 [Sesbania bispinosa]
MLDVVLLQSFIPISCNVLIENEGDTEALKPFIVKMSSKHEGFVPQMDAKAMKAFINAGKRKRASQSSEPVVVIDTENEVSSSTVSDKLVSKRGRGGNELSPSAQPTPSSEHPPSSMADQEIAQARKVSTELESLQEKFKNLNLEKDKVSGELVDLKKEKAKSDTLLEETAKLLKATEENLLVEQQKHQNETNQLKAEIAFQYEQGFEKAVVQVKFLHPDIKIDEVGAFKEIQDGKLVDLPDEE